MLPRLLQFAGLGISLLVVACAGGDSVDARIQTAIAAVPSTTPQPAPTPQPTTTAVIVLPTVTVVPTATPQLAPTPQPTASAVPIATPQPTPTPVKLPATATSSVPIPTPTPAPILPVVSDSFDNHQDPGNPALELALVGRFPDLAPAGAAWAETGWGVADWRSVQTGAGRVAVQRAGRDLEYRLHVETGVGNQDIQTSLVVGGGIVGLVGRFANESNFIIAWVDPSGGITLARIEAGVFYAMGSAFVALRPDLAFDLRLVINGSGTRVFVDDTPVIENDYNGMGLNTRAGLFARNATTAHWDDFVVKPAP